MLNERKARILEAIITDYIDSAEPIGSRTIAKKYNMGISSATIRNEMSDLEDMGLIVQPHASAGRVPSDKGYRLYVNSLMPRRDSGDKAGRGHRSGAEAPEGGAGDVEYLRQLIAGNINQVGLLMREIAQSIALLTKYTTIVSEPRFCKTRIRHVQLVPLDEKSVVMVLITDSGVVNNHVVVLERAPEYELLLEITQVLNRRLCGCASEDICEEDFIDVFSGMHPDVRCALSTALSVLSWMLRNEDDRQVYTGGVRNILSYPEFSDISKARKLFQALEEREMLISLLDSCSAHHPESFDDEAFGVSGWGNIHVVIGSENTAAEMKDCSLVKANYRFGGHNYGAIGIIGPTRMDYVQTISILGVVVNNINKALES